MATVALFVVGFLSPVAHADQTNSAAALKGTWTGPSSGYEDSIYTTGFEKIVITKVKGSSARGTWQYKASGAANWSGFDRNIFRASHPWGCLDVDLSVD